MHTSIQQTADSAAPGSVPRDGTFALAARLLRPKLRAEMQQLYGALRVLDDLVDDGMPEAADRVAAVESWCASGDSSTPETEVFADLAARYGLQPEPVAEFCLAMRHDLEQSEIADQPELELYCRRVAGSVGVMVAQIMGASAHGVESGMSALGTGVQLAHILRDLDVDLAQNRIFIPREAIDRHGSIEPGDREELLREQIARADAFFDEAAPVYKLLPEGKRAVAACGGLYREILRQIERDGYGKRSGVPIVPRSRQRLVIARALLLIR